MTRTIFCLLATLALIACVRGSAWNDANDPALFSDQFEYNFDKLPLNATDGEYNTPYSDTYWPSYQSGIAHRWAAEDPQDFSYSTYSLKQLKKLSVDDLSQLSPAEKYDIYMGRYDYPTVKSEWMRTSPDDASWEGLCHGWAPAALYFKQPFPVTLQSKDNITIPFGSSDVKALLTYYLAEYAENVPTLFAGQRCKYDIQQNPDKGDLPMCADLNAGAFHVLIANQVGVDQTGFVVDRDRSIQVWNQPTFAYEATIRDTRAPSQGAAPGTVKEVGIRMNMRYTVEVQPQWKAYSPFTRASTYSYYLELDANNHILGGSYNTYDRSDFMWKMLFDGNFTDYYGEIETIYQASIKPATREENKFYTGPVGPLVPHRETILRDSEGVFGTISNHLALTPNVDDQPGYPPNLYEKWLITPSHSAKAVELRFKVFGTERYRDKVRVYEYDPETSQRGALVAVLHGSIDPPTLRIEAPGVWVSFKTDESGSGVGFLAGYTALHD